jgi:hypothetical protein
MSLVVGGRQTPRPRFYFVTADPEAWRGHDRLTWPELRSSARRPPPQQSNAPCSRSHLEQGRADGACGDADTADRPGSLERASRQTKGTRHVTNDRADLTYLGQYADVSLIVLLQSLDLL